MNFNFSNTPLGNFRLIAFIEGVSFIVLLFIAMPLKYFAGIPEAVKVVGWVHGLLFILYLVFLIRVKFSLNWSLWQVAVALAASVIPFGTFVLDKRLRAEEKTLG